jgi:hypothetical protein
MGHRFVAARQAAKRLGHPCGNIKKGPILSDI